MVGKGLKTNFLFNFIALVTLIAVSACSSVKSPEMTQKEGSLHHDKFDTKEALLDRVKSIKKSMKKDEVYELLDITEGDFRMLSRNEILLAMYGTDEVEFTKGLDFIRQLDGFSLDFRSIEKKTGLSSPVSMRTKQEGYEYTLVLVFKGDTLYERPIIYGGDVYDSKTNSLLKFLSPSRLVSAAL